MNWPRIESELIGLFTGEVLFTRKASWDNTTCLAFIMGGVDQILLASYPSNCDCTYINQMKNYRLQVLSDLSEQTCSCGCTWNFYREYEQIAEWPPQDILDLFRHIGAWFINVYEEDVPSYFDSKGPCQLLEACKPTMAL